MMLRRLCISLLALVLCCITASAWEPSRLHRRLDLGVEWGYTSTFFRHYHFNYTDDAGSRVNSLGPDWTYKSNGHLDFVVGVKFARHFTADLCTGWVGVYEDRSGFPLDLRLSYFFNGYDRDSFKLFAEGGYLFLDTFKDRPAYQARLGSTYRIALDEYLSLDLGLAYNASMDHPASVYDTPNHYIVPNENLRRSDTFYSGVSFIVALSF